MSNIFLNKMLFVVEILVAEILCTCYLKKKRRFVWRFIGYLAISLAAGAAFPVFVNNFPYACFMFFFLFAVTVASLKLCYDEPWINVLFCGIAAYTVQHFAYELANLVLIAAVRNSEPIFGMYTTAPVDIINLTHEQIIYALIYVLFYYAVYGVFFVVFGKRIKKSERLVVKNWFLLLLTAVGLLVDIVLNSGYIYLSDGADVAAEIIIYSSNCLCCLLLLSVQFGQIRQKALETELGFVRKLWEQDKEQYELFKENMELLNLKCHDMKHQIREIGKGTHVPSEALAEIERTLTVYDIVVKTGNETLDTVLTEKNLRCNKNKIAFTCVADGNAVAFMSEADIYSLFGNALDNAIEAVMKIDDEQNRIIGLSVYSSGSFVTIEAHNTYAVDPEFVKGLPKTTKSEPTLHGFGVKSIKLIAEKYGGNMNISARNGLFNLSVLLPMPDVRLG